MVLCVSFVKDMHGSTPRLMILVPYSVATKKQERSGIMRQVDLIDTFLQKP